MTKQILYRIAVCIAAMVVVAWNTGCERSQAADDASHDNHAHAASESNTQRDPSRLWCNEHDVYEDECFKCHPELKREEEHGDNQAHEGHETDSAANEAVLMCTEHRLPEKECGNCRPDSVATIPVGQGLKVRFPSELSTTKAGVVFGRPETGASGATQDLLGQVTFNRNRLANIATLVPGVVVDVLKNAGENVQEGEIVATVQSPEIAQVISEFTKALAEARLAGQSLSREKDLFEKQISARQDLEAAQAASAVSQSAVSEARQHLLNLGMTRAEIETAAKGGAVASVLPVRAPFAGTVIERSAVRGAAVEPGTALFQVADLSTMWMQVSVPESRLASIETGLQIQGRFEAYPEEVFDGTIEWIAPVVDSQTRMLRARAVLDNSKGRLKDGLFGRVLLMGPAQQSEVTVPSSAVQEIDGKPVVFRKLENDLFETRRVDVRPASDGHVVILAGLAPEEEIVTEGSYIVKSELLKARLGAGCADH